MVGQDIARVGSRLFVCLGRMAWAAALLFAILLAACARTSTPVVTTPAPAAPVADETVADAMAEMRAQMVELQIAGRGVTDTEVLEAMRQVPRHLFVPDDLQGQAYADHPLPIGHGQTISQPYIVALMSQAVKVEPGDRVLEIGTGSGYQAAILDALGAETYTIEIIPELAAQAAQRLQDLGYTGIRVRQADGYFGWEDEAPFDAIIVTAAPDHLPQPLANQLAEGGRLVVPIGPQGSYQTLWLFEKVQGELQATNLGAVSFVPFTRSAD